MNFCQRCKFWMGSHSEDCHLYRMDLTEYFNRNRYLFAEIPNRLPWFATKEGMKRKHYWIAYKDLQSLVFTCYEAGKITTLKAAELLEISVEKVDSFYSEWKIKQREDFNNPP